MEPIKLGQTIEENVQEVFAWSFLFPITMWRLLRAPLRFLQAADQEMEKPAGDRFDDRMSPVIFFLFSTLTIALLAAYADGNKPKSSVSDLMMGFALIVTLSPLIWTLAELVALKKPWAKSSFRRSFARQCYLTCPPWFAMALWGFFEDEGKPLPYVCLSLTVLVALMWMVVTEYRLWRSRGAGRWRTALVLAVATAAAASYLPALESASKALGLEHLWPDADDGATPAASAPASAARSAASAASAPKPASVAR